MEAKVQPYGMADDLDRVAVPAIGRRLLGSSGKRHQAIVRGHPLNLTVPPCYMSEGGGRTHSSTSQTLVRVAEWSCPDRGRQHDHRHLAKDVTRRSDAGLSQLTLVNRRS